MELTCISNCCQPVKFAGFKALDKSPKTYCIIYNVVMIAFPSPLIYYGKCVGLSLLPVDLNTYHPNNVRQCLNKY